MVMPFTEVGKTEEKLDGQESIVIISDTLDLR